MISLAVKPVAAAKVGGFEGEVAVVVGEAEHDAVAARDRASVPLAWSHEAQVRVAVVDEHQLGEGPHEGVEAVGAAAL